MKRYYVISIVAIVVVFITAISVLSYLTLQLKKSVTVTLEVNTNAPSVKGVKWKESDIENTAQIIHNRLIKMGVFKAVVSANPPNRVIVKMPDLPNKQRILDALITQANLTFRYVPQLDPDGIWTTEDITDKNGDETGYEQIVGTNGMPVPKWKLQALVFNMPPILDGSQLLPYSSVDLSTGEPTIYFEFNDNGKRIMKMFTQSHIGKTLAIFMDDKLVCAPVITSAIPGAGIIHGSFTVGEAKTLADLLNAGTLPFPMRIQNISVKP